MKWRKLGLMFDPSNRFDWMLSHATNPTIDRLSDNISRVYFASRDISNCSQVGYFEFDINNPFQILSVSKRPVLELGTLGAFDDSGVFPSWIITDQKIKYLYYIGWSRGVTVPFYAFIGLAISEDEGKSFRRISSSPIVGRNEIDHYFLTSPCVIHEKGKWRMWYASGVKWEKIKNDVKHYYHIKYGESSDGVHWNSLGIICIDFKDATEYAICRPFVIFEDNIYKMWYCYRGNYYKLGYAESEDGLKWDRKDDRVGIDISKEGWDSEMICYPAILEYQQKKYMLYNGNDYGKTGIGLAVLD